MISALDSLKGKVRLVIAVAVVLLAVQTVLMTTKVGRIIDNSRTVRDQSTAIVAKSYELNLAVVQVQQWLTDVSATRAQDGLDDGFDEAAASAQTAQGLLAELAGLNPAQRALYETLRGHFDAYYAAGRRMAEAYVEGGPAAGNRMMADFDRTAESLQTDVAQAMESARTLASHDLDQSIAMAEDVWAWNLGVSAVFLLLAIGAGLFLSAVVLRPICGTAAMARELALGDGDLTRRLDGDRRDEIGSVARGINEFVEKIEGTVRTMGGVVAQLNESVGHLAQVAGQGHEKAAGQLRETETVAASMTEMKASADEIAHTAVEAAQHTDTTARQAAEGGRAVANAARVVQSLERGIARAQDVINSVGEDSSSIGTVLDVIRGISEQTNLLALNAAIEAARAGEQGRGFAVVADEVRTLASRTQQSTEEIQTMISKLQAHAGDSVKAMADSREMATAGVAEIEKARGLLDAILEQVGGMRDMTQLIATAAGQQSQVSGEMDSNLVNIAELARGNAVNAESLSAASTQLGDLARQVGSLIGRFKVG